MEWFVFYYPKFSLSVHFFTDLTLSAWLTFIMAKQYEHFSKHLF